MHPLDRSLTEQYADCPPKERKRRARVRQIDSAPV